jgi:hypothetical protein
MFAATAATIWVSAGVCKLYYTKRAADLFEAKGWPPVNAKSADADVQKAGEGSIQISSLDEANKGENSVHAMLSGSKSICYAAMGTVAAALGFWLITPTPK